MIHRMYDQRKRKFIKKLNQLYINLDYKLINSIKLQVCVFKQFSLLCMHKIIELRLISKDNTRKQQNRIRKFHSKIDNNNGFISPKKINHNNSKNRLSFMIHNQVINYKNIESRISKEQNKGNIPLGSNRNSNEMNIKYFRQSNRLKNIQKSPGRLFQNAEEELIIQFKLIKSWIIKENQLILILYLLKIRSFKYKLQTLKKSIKIKLQLIKNVEMNEDFKNKISQYSNRRLRKQSNNFTFLQSDK